jgi:Fe-S-cluster containining protein
MTDSERNGMPDSENKAGIEPMQLGLDNRFKFRCHKGVDCFTKCCRGINIVLTPYDIIRLKNRLQLSSEEFIALYTDVQLLEKTDLPVVTLKLLDDEQQSCPFVRDDGCIIYEDRPTTCRYYPLGVASLSYKEGADNPDFIFLSTNRIASVSKRTRCGAYVIGGRIKASIPVTMSMPNGPISWSASARFHRT